MYVCMYAYACSTLCLPWAECMLNGLRLDLTCLDLDLDLDSASYTVGGVHAQRAETRLRGEEVVQGAAVIAVNASAVARAVAASSGWNGRLIG